LEVQDALVLYARHKPESLEAQLELDKAHAAFTDIYTDTFADTLTLVSTMLRDHPDSVHDVVQETYSRAFKHIKGFKGEYQFTTWLYRITTNASLTFLKKEGKKYRAERSTTLLNKDNDDASAWELLLDTRQSSDDHEAIELALDNDALYKEVKEELAKLSPNLRATILARYAADMSVAQVAHMYNLSESAVKVRSKRGLDSLRAKILHAKKEESDSNQ
jgi:RNA polymerase sigma-70 factor, ECF subfamily